MFCYQCEQTSKGEGCTTFGVCGKSPEVATLQDLLIYTLRGVSQIALEGRKVGVKDEKTDLFISEAAFATLTNVNFDPESIIKYLNKTIELRESLRKKVKAAGGKTDLPGAANLVLEKTKEGLVQQGKQFGIQSDSPQNPDLRGLHWLLTYGIKGVSAYAYHAYRLGKKDDKVFEFIEHGLAAILDLSLGVNDFVGLALKCGEINIRAMELLDAGNTETYGHPVPTKVPLGAQKRQSHPSLRTRPQRLRSNLEANPRQRHHRLHTRRNAPNTRLPKTQSSTHTSTATTAQHGKTSNANSQRSQAPSS